MTGAGKRGNGRRVPARRKPKITTLKNKADGLFSLVIRYRDRECRRCGSDGAGRPLWWLQCAHVFSRGYMLTRFDEDNAMCLCAGCHQSFGHRPLEWEDFCIEQMGEDEYNALKRKAKQYAKYTVADYTEGIIPRLKARLETLTPA